MLEAIRKRRSYRKFSSKIPEEEKIEEILKAAMFAPSGENRRPWEFVVVRDEETRKRLSQSSPWADFVAEAPVTIVVVGSEKDSRLWLEDCSLVAGHIYLEATNQGLGTCWAHVREGKTVEGKDAEEFVKIILKIPGEKRILCLMAVGYPTEEKKEHRDSEFEKKKIHKETWK